MNDPPSESNVQLTTEARNPASSRIDSLSALEIVRLINQEDARIAEAIGRESESIAEAIDVIAERIRGGGRLVYIGAGTSGRLGVLDASECPPTYSTPPEMVVGIIAGGTDALTRSIEGAEDHPEYAERDLAEINFSDSDVLVGIATSGRTPYVIGGLKHAQRIGSTTVGLSCNYPSDLQPHSNIMISPIVGPEVISGSTRMKAGTATKMILNMLTTGAMVRLGKTYGNLMVDLKASNSKLKVRSARIVADITGLAIPEAELLLERCDGEVKTAVVSQLRGVTADKAREEITRVGGHLHLALEASV